MSRLQVPLPLIAALAAIALPAALAPAASAAPDAQCNPLSTRTCLAPFPSNYWSEPDASSATGLRLKVEDEVLRPELLDPLPKDDGISPSGIFNGATGFSAGVGATFEFTDRTGPVAASGGQAVVAWDLDDNKRVKVHAFISDLAKDGSQVARPTNTIQVFPQSRWAYGHRILIAITDQLSIPTASDPQFDELAAQTPANARGAAYIEEVRAGLAQAGLASSTVRNATLFTVRTRDEVLSPTQRLIDATTAAAHPIRNVRMSWDFINPSVAGLVTGEVRVDNFRTRDGKGPVDFSGNTRKDQWIPFRLTLPEAAQNGRTGVVIYTHGIGAFKESDLVVTQMNAQHNLSTLSVDWPNHGARSGADGGNLLSLLDPKNLGTLSGMFNQAVVDMIGVYKAIQTMNIDVMSRKSIFNPFGIGRDGRNDIDGNKISQEGTSLGGVLGANFAALAPNLKGIIFHVTGVGLSHAISQTELWKIFGNILPKDTTGTEENILIAALQQAIDGADPINTIDFVRYPQPGSVKKPMLVVTGAGDSLVPNPTSVALANLVDLPLVGPALYPMANTRRTADYDPDGYAIRQYPPFTAPFNIPLITGSTTHGAFAQPASYVAQGMFIERFMKPPH